MSEVPMYAERDWPAGPVDPWCKLYVDATRLHVPILMELSRSTQVMSILEALTGAAGARQ